MSARVDLQQAYILHTRPYRDTSLLVDVLSQDYGKISLIAKGARKAKNNQRYLLQAFKPVLVSWQGKSSLKTLTSVEPIAAETPQSSPFRDDNLHNSALSNTALKGDKLYSAMYANELLVYLLPQDDPTDHIFEHYQCLLDQLIDPSSSLEPCLRYFEFHLLEELGYGINFISNASSGESLEAGENYFFIQNHGFVTTREHPEIRDVSFLGEQLICIAQQDFTDKRTRQTAKMLSRVALKPHLRGRKLKSRELFSNRVDLNIAPKS